VCYALFGNLEHPHSIVELHATKVVAGSRDELGTHVRVW
jgi:hypothetical protein